ncbi:FlgN family protein [Candidatus Methylobacter favarea]|uniref:FlgN family protein n=1 Tax=Candidatus Methylobacter favarea TaxID=2707345 RepID=A0A8S0X3F0_9GAMM|nr:flagellar protein FlgN [Candidatus Methylobacter favarea]CAA9892684.1 FlgN family protein [Candidatus Methylobacter favarea]
MTIIENTCPITARLILNGLYLTQQLHDQLNLEAEALKSMQHAESIINIVASKKHLVGQLEQFNTQLSQLLATEKLANNQQDIEEYFQRAETAGLAVSEMADNWAQMRLLWTKCRSLNEQNGASIELLKRHVDRSLHILKGKPQSANTYGPDGSSKSEPFTRSLISV